MADITWPAAPMPQRMLFQGFAADDDEDRESFQPDKGPPIYAPGLMLDSAVYTVAMEIPQDQLTGLRSFRTNDCIRGSQQFIFPEDPLTKETNVRLRFESPFKYAVIQDIADLWMVSFSVRRMP